MNFLNTPTVSLITAILLLAPLLGAALNGRCWDSKKIKTSFLISGSACFISFLSALALFVFSFSAFFGETPSFFTVSFFEWLKVGDLSLSFSYLIDPLSLFMALLITGVGFLIHVFSLYYMSHDPRPFKYFAYLNLFVFCMLNLVLADHLLLLFLGWEGVGLCSYLLISFWFEKKEKALAGMKAFLVNRIGDMGFVLGLILLWQEFLTLNFAELSSAVAGGDFNLSTVKWAGFCFFIGAVGKSAQIPLYMWLPSAMAGPTPVSALIHAATMVTAGLYLMARLNFLVTLSPELMTLIGWVGVLTALFSALIATVQSDIKKVLAYSTVSQLGFMFVAVGAGAFVASLFHLLTHGFFKALLFLGAGAVIHALGGEQNIHRMGGLKKALPWTYLCWLAGFFALIGLPPFSGFFSKDEVLWASFASGNWAIGVLGLGAAGLTAFYMTRLTVLVFLSPVKRGALEGRALKSGALEQGLKGRGEGGVSALLPLGVLAFLSLMAGVLGIPHVLSAVLPGHPPHLIAKYLKPVLGEGGSFEGSLLAEGGLMLLSFALALGVFMVTKHIYLRKREWVAVLKAKNPLSGLLEGAFRVDWFCQMRVVAPFLKMSRLLFEGVEEGLLKGGLKALQKGLSALNRLFEGLQDGKAENYVLLMVLGLIFLVLAILL